MDPVQPRISLIYTTNNEKNLAPRVCSKKNFQKPFRVSSQISVDLNICVLSIEIHVKHTNRFRHTNRGSYPCTFLKKQMKVNVKIFNWLFATYWKVDSAQSCRSPTLETKHEWKLTHFMIWKWFKFCPCFLETGWWLLITNSLFASLWLLKT